MIFNKNHPILPKDLESNIICGVNQSTKELLLEIANAREIDLSNMSEKRCFSACVFGKVRHALERFRASNEGSTFEKASRAA